MAGFLIVMIIVVVMALGAAIYFKHKENQSTKALK
jgi:septation ring formation regulator EzrA